MSDRPLPLATYINTDHGQEIFDPSNKEHRLLMAWSNFGTKYGWGIIGIDEWLKLFDVPDGAPDPWDAKK